ncbi:MAG: thioredoxin family protein [Pseudobdellovibrionaceae bacterium]|nr:MAG: thioredoxin family protein [Pseudobdellovibrionaceae bacterium]
MFDFSRLSQFGHKRKQVLKILFGVILSALTACKSQKELSGSATPAEIHWNKQGMDAALKLSLELNKPLFVYWGADWCPPCNEVKSTLFREKQFIEATRDYLAVYLDGDTEDAQKWGEKLKAYGYPTLMLLTPQGREILRLSPYNSSEDIVATMNFAKNQWDPVGQVLDELLISDSIDKGRLKSLVNYSWSQDKDIKENPKPFLDKLFKLESKLDSANYAAEKATLFLTALDLKLGSKKEGELLPDPERQTYRKRVEILLADKNTLGANMVFFAYSGDEYLQFLTTADDDRDRKAWMNFYAEQLRVFRNSKGVSRNNYYSSFYPLAGFSKKQGYIVDEADRRALQSSLNSDLRVVKDTHERVTLVNHAGYLLNAFGNPEEAKEILKSEIKAGLKPYYFMSSLGYIAKEEGQNKEALKWFEESYKEAKGPATRLQWYSNYVTNLMAIEPDSKDLIKKHVATLLGDYTGMVDSFWGRNYRVLESLRKKVSEWSVSTKESKWLAMVKDSGLKRCSQSTQETYKTSCEKYYKSY